MTNEQIDRGIVFLQNNAFDEKDNAINIHLIFLLEAMQEPDNLNDNLK